MLINLDRDFGTGAGSMNQMHSQSIMTIPLVFHVLSDSTTPFVSDSAIYEQVDALNSCYAHTNPDTPLIMPPWVPFVGRSNIRFCLADRDSMGNPFSGIIRTTTDHGIFTSPGDVYDTAMGGELMWDPSRYFNVYVCKLPPGNGGVAILGAQPALVQHNLVGPKLALGVGTTLVHEIGHTFYLRHPWGVPGLGCNQLGDQIADTPPQAGPLTGCSTNPYYDSCTTSGIGFNVNNYMDYGSCRRMFTQGQVAWMENYVLSLYSSLLTSTACSFATQVKYVFNSENEVYPNPSSGIFKYRLSDNAKFDIRIKSVSGKDLNFISQINGNELTIDLSNMASGVYILTITGDERRLRKLLLKN
jgi:hypothetical protein